MLMNSSDESSHSVKHNPLMNLGCSGIGRGISEAPNRNPLRWRTSRCWNDVIKDINADGEKKASVIVKNPTVQKRCLSTWGR